MHNYAHNKATEKNNPCKILKLDSGKAAAVRTESDRSQDGKRPQSGRKGAAVRTESGRSQDGKRPQSRRKATASGNVAVRAEVK